MMRTRALAALLLCGLIFGCGSGPATNGGGDTPDGPAGAPAPKPPEWFLNPPYEPGKAFYGVGMIENVTSLALSKSAIEKRAIEELAGVLRTQIKSVLKDYMSSTSDSSNPTAPPEEEQLIQRVAIAAVNQAITGAHVIKRAFGEKLPNGTYRAYALAKLDFSNMAKSLFDSAKESMSRVSDNADKAFDELENLMADRQKKDRPAPGGTPGGGTPGTSTGGNGGTSATPGGGPVAPTGTVDLAYAKKNWPSAVDRRYSASQYLLGYGQASGTDGNAIATAFAGARDQIASQFTVEISSEFNSLQSERVRVSGGNTEREGFQSLSQQIKARSQVTLEGLKDADHKVDTEANAVLALSVLHKKTMADKLSARINNLIDGIQADVSFARRQIDQRRWLTALTKLKDVRERVAEARLLIAQLKFIAPPGYPIPTLEINFADVLGLLASCGDNLIIVFKLQVKVVLEDGSEEDRGEGRIRQSIVDAVQGRNAAVRVKSPSGSFQRMPLEEVLMLGGDELRDAIGAGPKYLIRGTVTCRFSGRAMGDKPLFQSGWDIEIVDIDSGDSIQSIMTDSSNATKAVHTRAEAAIAQSLKYAAKQLAKDIEKQFE